MKVKRIKGIKCFIGLILVLGLVVFSIPSFAGWGNIDSEIQAKIKTMNLDTINTVIGQIKGKRVSFTPANLSIVADLEQGQIIGVMETEITLPPGKYVIYVKKISGQWKGFAAVNGTVVSEVARISVEQKSNKDTNRPQFIAADVLGFRFPLNSVFIRFCFGEQCSHLVRFD